MIYDDTCQPYYPKGPAMYSYDEYWGNDPFEDGCPECGGNPETNGLRWWCEGKDPLPKETDEDLNYDPANYGCGWAFNPDDPR
jgi:hypothetical protein